MRKGELRRQALLDVARQLFYEKGYRETSVDDILQAQGCSKGSFYHCFDTKLDVLTAISEEKAAEWFELYCKTPCATSLDRLNALLYCMHPFRQREEQFLSTLLELRSR